MTNYCSPVESENNVTWTSYSEQCLTRKDAILPEVEQDSMTFIKINKYLLKVCHFARAQELRGVALKFRHGNTIFTKMNCLKKVFCHYIYMVIIMITRGRLAIGDVVTSMERPFWMLGLHVLITLTERIIQRHIDVSCTFSERSDERPTDVDWITFWTVEER